MEMYGDDDGVGVGSGDCGDDDVMVMDRSETNERFINIQTVVMAWELKGKETGRYGKSLMVACAPLGTERQRDKTVWNISDDGLCSTGN
ncbi:hypothetical protein PoB_003221500 [Plakobranchus ocellatus]|uniref:Uncharacterized protein n=1 Tax=Plakobranchus ocellatus TaxID=259542 RepID=A0AAV4AC08_9GAST|nr:hypothetical protein PoB_003221500 [Plakobranchus ocellatus]